MGARPLNGKVALITGSSRGIGLATARELGRLGAGLALNARGAERLEQACAGLRDHGCEAQAFPADVSDPQQCEEMIARVLDRFGRLDIIINNAGVSMRANLEELDAETCRRVVDVNLLGCIYPTLFGLEAVKSGRGSLVYISSIAGMIGLPSASLYCATKFALRGLADSIRCELEPVGVHVGVVYVGFTENDPDKRVLGGAGSGIEPDRPAHMSQEQVGRKVAELVRDRRRQAVLTPVGKLAEASARLFPGLAERSVILARRHNISELLGMR